MPTIDDLDAQLDRLASIDPGDFPIVSLYLDLRPNEQGRDRFEPFIRKELNGRVETYEASGPERESLERDAEKIRRFLAEIDPSLNGIAIFACSGAGIFETVPLAAPIESHRVYIASQAYLYPLARVLDQYPRYVALLADTHSARIFVFAANALEKTGQIEGTKTKRHKMGGWSQARYQRHIENYHQQHAKEVIDALARIVRDEAIERIVIAGDDVIVPLLREQMPRDLAEKVVDTLKLDMRAPEREVLEATIASLREKDAADDRERVQALIGAYRGNGLAVVGAEATLRAFELGQVDELLMPGNAASLGEQRADRFVTLARQTSARVRMIEDPTLLTAVGGVGAFLRFKL